MSASDVPVLLFFDANNENELATLDLYQAKIPALPDAKFVSYDINADQLIQKELKGKTPILEVGPYRIQDVNSIEKVGNAVQDVKELRERNPNHPTGNRYQLSRSERFTMWLGKNYMILFNLLVFLYIGLPFAAPVLMKINAPFAAKVIYTIYKPFCHQLAYRSWFLFGDQPAYPREIAHIEGLETFEHRTHIIPEDLSASRNIIGDEQMGYKVALCERDVAIYGSILLFGLLFMIVPAKINSLPWYLWVAFGIIPMGIDGASQLPALLNIQLPFDLVRESSPFLRTLTGALFGITTSWYLYPMIRDGMRDNYYIMKRKTIIDAGLREV